MSRVFYDHLLEFEEIEIELKKLGLDPDEKRELEHLIDSMVHHRVIGCVLTHLPQAHHEEFLHKFQKSPYDPALIAWIDQRIEASVEEHVKAEMKKLKREILEDIKPSSKKQK